MKQTRDNPPRAGAWLLFETGAGDMWLNREIGAVIVPISSVKLSTLAAAVATEFLRDQVDGKAIVTACTRELRMLPTADGPIPTECTYCRYSVEEPTNA